MPASDHSGLQSCAWLCGGELHIDSRFRMGLFPQGSTVFARVVITYPSIIWESCGLLELEELEEAVEKLFSTTYSVPSASVHLSAGLERHIASETCGVFEVATAAEIPC